jgi:NAD+ kinase
MKKIYIYPNPKSTACISAARELSNLLFDANVTVTVSECCKEQLSDLPIGSPEGADIALVLGGDGTILRCAMEVLDLSIPILGINFGHLGYMSDVSPEDIPHAIRHILNDELYVEKRAVISGRLVDPNGKQLTAFRAVNDITIFRGDQPGLTHTAVHINDTYMDTYHADGVLVSTPNGSTAYNYSAGGPIVNPAARNMILTPICCHSLLSRSIVLAECDLIRLTPQGELVPQIAVDGMAIPLPSTPFSLEVALSATPFLLARLTRSNFYDVLRRKMVPSHD